MKLRLRKAPARSVIEADSNITDRRSKEVVHRKASRKIGKQVQPGPDQVVGYVRVGDSLKITKKFQSAGTEITAEIPFLMTPGDLSQLKGQFTLVREEIDEVLVDHLKELKEVLQELAKEDGR